MLTNIIFFLSLYFEKNKIVKIKKRDIKKKRLCKMNDVILIYYNYDEEITYEVLKNKLNKHGINIWINTVTESEWE